MNRYFTKSFFKFFLGFMVIIGAAFAVLAAASSSEPRPQSVDWVAHPR